MQYSHSYQDPDTGDIIDVMVDDGAYRNAVHDHRSGGGHAAPRRPSSFPAPPRGDNIRPRTPGRPDIVRHPPSAPMHYPGAPGGAVYASGEYLAIRKAAFVELIPAAGQLLASFLGRPDVPRAVGDDIIDRNNAALHRDALAVHEQNQTRILALTQLAARALRILAA